MQYYERAYTIFLDTHVKGPQTSVAHVIASYDARVGVRRMSCFRSVRCVKFLGIPEWAYYGVWAKSGAGGTRGGSREKIFGDRRQRGAPFFVGEGVREDFGSPGR